MYSSERWVWDHHGLGHTQWGCHHGWWLTWLVACIVGSQAAACRHSRNPQTATSSSLWLGVHVALSSWLGLHVVCASWGGPWSGSHVVESSSLRHMLSL